ncbi:conjugative transposon protein TraN [Flavobacterium sp. Sd200]|uniref:conjugative transposon protein TraN n=1 Tax=Flavobacterium sp. Sd200 TaxID=2692211 RepID=UPI00136CC992|nr:conjugative transposon protein TraN [Flavobacterium sp. Sd200]MXN91742.1 conjugative transposon protein TraN [Flavobacterium sp. Sd200]
MKKFIVIVLVMLSALTIQAQDSAASDYVQISPEPLTIAVGKTTNLIYPFAIKSVDRGSRDILVQKAKGLENILQVKAGRECFEATNLTVITTDGKLYSYNVGYNEATNQLNLDYTGGRVSATEEYNEALSKELSATVASLERNIYRIKDNKGGIKLFVEGLYVHGNLFFFKVRIKNKTNINYDISQLRLFIRDQKKAKRTASQENEIKQLYIHNPVTMIKGLEEQTIVITVPKFTIPDKKEMILQLMEKNGGRHLEVTVKNKTIVKSTSIP